MYNMCFRVLAHLVSLPTSNRTFLLRDPRQNTFRLDEMERNGSEDGRRRKHRMSSTQNVRGRMMRRIMDAVGYVYFSACCRATRPVY